MDVALYRSIAEGSTCRRRRKPSNMKLSNVGPQQLITLAVFAARILAGAFSWYITASVLLGHVPIVVSRALWKVQSPH